MGHQLGISLRRIRNVRFVGGQLISRAVPLHGRQTETHLSQTAAC